MDGRQSCRLLRRGGVHVLFYRGIPVIIDINDPSLDLVEGVSPELSGPLSVCSLGVIPEV